MNRTVSEFNSLEWGLNPSFNCFRKVFIVQLRNAIESVEVPGFAIAFEMAKTPIQKVEIVGHIRSIARKRNKIILSCDDGTGCVQCVKFCNQEEEFPLLQFKCGDLVSINGDLAKLELNGEPYDIVINIRIINPICDPNLELLHWATTMMHQSQVDKVSISP